MTPAKPRLNIPLTVGVVVSLLLQIAVLGLRSASAEFSPVLHWLDALLRFSTPLLVSYVFYRIASRQTNYLKQFWHGLALYALVFSLAIPVHALRPYLGPQTTEFLSAVVFFPSFAILIYAVWQLWRFGFSVLVKVRQTLDGLGGVVATLIILWWGYQGHLFEQFAQTQGFMQLVIFEVLVLIVSFNILFNPRERHAFVLWLTLGMLLNNGTNIAYASFRVIDPETPAVWWMVLASLGFALMAYGAWRSLDVQSEAQLRRNGQWVGLIPPALFVLALLITAHVLFSRALPEQPQLILVYLFMGLALLIFVRQLIVNLENNRLNHDLLELNQTLEQRVEERSKELQSSRNYLLAAERLASLGQLTAGLAHEVNTPLAAALTSLKQADTLVGEYRDSIGHPQVTADDHREIASELGQKLGAGIGSLERLGEIVRKMRSQTRQQNEGKSRMNLTVVIQETLDLLQHPAMKAKVKLSFEAPHELWLELEPGRLGQVITNLVTNALHACEDAQALHSGQGKHVWVRLYETGPEVHIEVADDGVGMDESVQARIFEPLFTTKTAGRGTGLGLPIVRDIVSSNLKGVLELRSHVGRGTTFTLRIPKLEVAKPVG